MLEIITQLYVPIMEKHGQTNLKEVKILLYLVDKVDDSHSLPI
jgi:hypothetical protein